MSPPLLEFSAGVEEFRIPIVDVALTRQITSARLAQMTRTGKATKRTSGRKSSTPPRNPKSLKSKHDNNVAAHAEAVRQTVDPHFEQQLKLYEQAVQHFHQQKLAKAKELLEQVNRELKESAEAANKNHK